MSLRPQGAAGLLVLVVAATGACSSPQACTEIGAESGVSVTVPGLATTPAATVEVCVEGTCSRALVVVPDEPVLVANPKVDSVESTTVTVRVLGPDGKPSRPPVRTTVTPRIVQPNGPDCEPTAYVASVTLPPR